MIGNKGRNKTIIPVAITKPTKFINVLSFISVGSIDFDLPIYKYNK